MRVYKDGSWKLNKKEIKLIKKHYGSLKRFMKYIVLWEEVAHLQRHGFM